MKDIMIDTKAIIGMRDEMEQIQGGVGLRDNPDNNSKEASQQSDGPAIITSNMFGEDGPSLGASALKAMNLSQGS
ncbi:MAG: hypothetical protein CL582_09660 [Alteromonadaceae bacterium]|nr:hypothetical protein [Alteromonadaceae bacterium]|tara:strand:+ start:1865 stop:2089 length:225 start_codon:yes stop_codon:yes gene_type:complete